MTINDHNIQEILNFYRVIYFLQRNLFFSKHIFETVPTTQN